MPWSNQSNSNGGGGGWRGSGGGGPWGQGPRNTGPNPPDLEELLRRSQDRLRRVLPGGGGGVRGISPLAIIAIVVVAAALIGYNFFTFRVQPEEVGIVLRFGERNRQVQPGLNFRLPYPIETVYTPKVTRRNQVTIGQVRDVRGGGGRDIPEESLILTGDQNIVNVDFTVFWVIKNASDYLFNIQNPEGTVKAVAESAMREVVGKSEIQPLLNEARQQAEVDVQQLMQATLDRYGSGIQVVQVQLLKVDPPDEVIASFRDVQAARQDNERVQNEARTYANRVVPEARGEAARIIAGANAYHDQTIAEAQGQADRFIKVYESYRTAPDVTRERLYLETMEQILNGTEKIIVDENSNAQGVVPFLPLSEFAPSRTAPAPGGR
jgi:membrane protease subunit HflK